MADPAMTPFIEAQILSLFDTDLIDAGMEALADLGIMTKDSEADEGYYVADANVQRYAPYRAAVLAALEREDAQDQEDEVIRVEQYKIAARDTSVEHPDVRVFGPGNE